MLFLFVPFPGFANVSVICFMLYNRNYGLQPALGGDAAAAPATDKPRAAPVNVIASSAAAPAASDKPRAPAQSSNTRARRLSYVTNDVRAHDIATMSSCCSISCY